MPINHDQKNYIKKHIKDQNLSEISQKLNLKQDEIIDYLSKKWGKEKLNNFLNHKTEVTRPKFAIKNHWLIFLILFILVFLTYGYFLNNVFVSDDIAEIVNKPEIANFERILQFPTGPLRHFIYWASINIGGLDPFVFRLSNLLFHLFSSYLVYLILFSIYKSKRVAFFASSLFAVHPAISEAVLWISGGMYAQYSFFFLLAFYFYINFTEKKYYFLSILFYLFSLMSHPSMPLGLWLIFPLYEVAFRSLKRSWVKLIPFLLIALVYLFINLGALPEREKTLQQVHYQEKGVDNIFLLLSTAISSYGELLFFPKTLTLYHSELNFSITSFTIRAIFTLFFFIAIPFVFFKKQKSIFFWLFFSLIALSPTLTPFRLNWIVAERYIYLPSIGVFALLGLSLNKLASQNKKFTQFILILFVLIIFVLSIRTFMRGIDWQTEDNLWIATGKTSPSSPNTHNNLGDVHGRHGDKEGALREFQRAIELKPNYADAYHNLGNTYKELNQVDKAMESYQMAAKLNPNLWQSYQNIAALYFEAKQFDLALENIQKAITITPNNINLVNNLGIVYLFKGDKEKSKAIFTQVLQVDPQNQFAKQGLIEASK